MSEATGLLVTAKAQRPARIDGTCFYCRQAIGAQHKLGCVLVRKQVRVRMTVEYDVSVPAHWTSETIESARNGGSSWCLDNAIAELQELADGPDGCLCEHAKFEYLADASGPTLSEE